MQLQTSPLPAPSVLVVEDHTDLRETLVEVLNDAGYHAVGAGHGGAALSVLREGLMPCVILLDLQMPVMNGWEFAKACVADERLKEIPVLVISANADRLPLPTDAHGAPLPYFRKPVSAEELLKRLADYAPPGPPH